GLLFGSRRLADPDARGGVEPRFRAGALPDLPRCQALRHRGRWLTLHWYRHVDGEAVRGVTTYELEGDRVARLRNYFYSPELLVELGAELQLPIRVNGYRWWAPEAP
ncbi:MAG TPA: RNA polymerase sigma factor, partial [Anaeromyxobacteraceae bacterium]|nr:RNA polymerase sigma factor [Anaeromyxobacteraceae bacterium]